MGFVLKAYSIRREQVVEFSRSPWQLEKESFMGAWASFSLEQVPVEKEVRHWSSLDYLWLWGYTTQWRNHFLLSLILLKNKHTLYFLETKTVKIVFSKGSEYAINSFVWKSGKCYWMWWVFINFNNNHQKSTRLAGMKQNILGSV